MASNFCGKAPAPHGQSTQYAEIEGDLTTIFRRETRLPRLLANMVAEHGLKAPQVLSKDDLFGIAWLYRRVLALIGELEAAALGRLGGRALKPNKAGVGGLT